jgi:hypothetical protein
MKEKIWIEKLVELLNEYDSSNWWKETDEWIDNIWKIYEFHSELQIISKKYWFIKWLVENDKIDLWEKLFNLTKNDNRKSIICDLDNNDFSWEDTFLMLLSISDTPIEDLILYLK